MRNDPLPADPPPVDTVEMLRVLTLAAGLLLIGAAVLEALRRMRGD